MGERRNLSPRDFLILLLLLATAACAAVFDRPSLSSPSLEGVSLFVAAPLALLLAGCILFRAAARDWLQISASACLLVIAAAYLATNAVTPVFWLWVFRLCAGGVLAADSWQVQRLRGRASTQRQSTILTTISEVGKMRPKDFRRDSMAMMTVATTLRRPRIPSIPPRPIALESFLDPAAGCPVPHGGPPAAPPAPQAAGCPVPHGQVVEKPRQPGVLKTPPTLTGGLPLIGHALEYLRDPIAFLMKAYQENGTIFSFRLGRQQITAVLTPEMSQDYYKAPDDLLNFREFYQVLVPMFGKGVGFDLPDEVREEHTTFLYPELRGDRLGAYTRLMAEETEAVLQRLPDQGEIDVIRLTQEITLRISLRCVIGPEAVDHHYQEFEQLQLDLLGGLNLIAFFNPYLPTPAHRRRDRARARMGVLLREIIRGRRQGKLVETSVLHHLMQVKDSHGQPLSDQVLEGNSLALVFASHANTASMSAWVGILLLQNPQWLKAVLAESDEVLGGAEPQPAAFTMDTLRRLSVLERVVKEIERLYPPTTIVMRTAYRDFECAGYRIPKGHGVLSSSSVSHRLPDVFARPDTFDPDRFAPPREEDRKRSFSLIGFGAGKHRCVGVFFAYLELKVIWTLVLRQFRMVLVNPQVSQDYQKFVASPMGPVNVRFERRKDRYEEPKTAATGS